MQLKFLIAKNALLHFYHYNYWDNSEIFSLKSFYDVNESDRIWKIKLRIICAENSDVIIASVVADASVEEQIFLYEKFYLDYSFTKIGMELHIHPNGLQRWRDKFLIDISSLINFHLPVADMFSRNKVEALIFSLERIISFFYSYGHYDIAFLNVLKSRLYAYQNLLFAIKHFLSSDSDNIGIRIIRSKILNPNISLDELENRLHVSHTTVSRYVHYFQQEFYPF